MKSLYFIAILPPDYLSSQINEIRKECSEKFKVYKALRSPVHITLYRPVFLEDRFMKTFSQSIKSVASSTKPFIQKLENFEEFSSQVVCIRALKSAELHALRQSIVSVFRKYHIDQQDTTGSIPFIPHITIAYRDVLPGVFPLIWNEYKDRRFRKQFLTDRITLLRHDNHSWNIHEEFMLSGADHPSLF